MARVPVGPPMAMNKTVKRVLMPKAAVPAKAAVKPAAFVNGLRPATRVPRDGRASPIVNTMAPTRPDAPARKAKAATGGSVNTFRTSTAKGTKFGDFK